MFSNFRKRRASARQEEPQAETVHVDDLLDDDEAEAGDVAPAAENEPPAPAVTHVLFHIDERWSVPVHVIDDHGELSAVTCTPAHGFPALRAGVPMTLRECVHSSGRLRDLPSSGWALTQAHLDPQFSDILDEAPGYWFAGRSVTLPYLMCVLRTVETANAMHARQPDTRRPASRARFDVHA